MPENAYLFGTFREENAEGKKRNEEERKKEREETKKKIN